MSGNWWRCTVTSWKMGLMRDGATVCTEVKAISWPILGI